MKKMKKILGVVTVLTAATLLTTGCGNAKNNTTTSSESSTTEKADKKDIEGSWYSNSAYNNWELTIDEEDAVLSSEYSDKLGTVDKEEKTITVKDSSKSEKVYVYKMIGKKLVLENEEDGQVLTFTREMPETSESSTSEESSDTKKSSKTSSSTKESSTTKDSKSTSTEKTAGEKIYSDAYIEVSKDKNILSFKNLTQESIRLSGDATLNGEREINMYDFGVIGDVAASGVKTQTVSKVKVEDIGDASEKEAGETLGGDKLVYHEMKAGDSITWSGEIMNDDYDTLAQISFTINY